MSKRYIIDPDEFNHASERHGTVYPPRLSKEAADVFLKGLWAMYNGVWPEWRIVQGESEDWPNGIILENVRVTRKNDDGSYDIAWDSEREL